MLIEKYAYCFLSITNNIVIVAANWPIQKINIHLVISLILLLRLRLTFAISSITFAISSFVANVLMVASTVPWSEVGMVKNCDAQ